MVYVRLQLKLPLPPIRASTLLAEPPFPLSERTYFMVDPLTNNHFLKKVVTFSKRTSKIKVMLA